MSPNERLERLFPNLKDSDYQITSPATQIYNCVAWAVGEALCWWWPVNEFGCYWPANAPFAETLEAFTAMFVNQGYQTCDEDGLEPGYSKIALYADSGGNPTHVARQLSSGTWTSKIGKFEDIEHQTLSALEGRLYGKVSQIMKRAKANEKEA